MFYCSEIMQCTIYFVQKCFPLWYIRDVQPCSNTGPNAHNQIGPGSTAACVKLSRLDNWLTIHGRLTIPFQNLGLSAGHKTSAFGPLFARGPQVAHPCCTLTRQLPCFHSPGMYTQIRKLDNFWFTSPISCSPFHKFYISVSIKEKKHRFLIPNLTYHTKPISCLVRHVCWLTGTGGWHTRLSSW